MLQVPCNDEVQPVSSSVIVPCRPRYSMSMTLGSHSNKRAELCPLDYSRPLDAWELRSLKKQKLDYIRENCRNNSGYNRGPKILKAMKELKSSSHS